MSPSLRHVVRAAVGVLAVTVGGAAALAAAPSVRAVDTGSAVVLSEVYGGGGNSGAPFANDFVELYNTGDQPVELSGWSVQYASASGTSWANTTPLTGSIAPRAYYLVAEAAGSTPATPLPTPDATGAIALSGTSGKVALVDNQSPLSGCAAACSTAAGVVDFVGYGAADDAAGGAPTASPGNARSAQRRTSPFTNSGVNAKDFTLAAPTPRAPAPVETGPDCSAAPVPPECQPGATTIQDVQGGGFLSPLAGTVVERVAGVVTGLRSRGPSPGFWVQQPTRDESRPAASSGLFVFQAGASVAVGDAVLVSGTVRDYYPLGSGETVATTASLSTTEITAVTAVTVVSAGNALPPPVPLTPTTLPGTYAPTPPGGTNVETIAAVDPARSVLEFFEAHEGMRVSVQDARVVGPGKPQYGEIYVTSKPDELRTPRGGTYLTGYAQTPTGRVLVLPVDGVVPAANVGDVLRGPTVGPVEWSTFGGYAIAATTLGSYQSSGLQQTQAVRPAEDQLSMGTYNVENLTPGDPDVKFARLAAGIVEGLAAPDVVAVEEIQDNSGAADDGTVSAELTLTRLTDAVRAAGGPAYRWAQVDPVNDQDGGQPGGNIRSVFLYDPERVELAPGSPGGSLDAVAASTASDGTAVLSLNPGRVDPTNPAWTASRKPLAAQFRFRGRSVVVVANHFNSKGGDQNADGRFQPPDRASEVQRLQQASVLGGFVRQVLEADPDADVVLAGDFNDFQFSPVLRRLTEDGTLLTDLVTTLPESEQYTYVYQGISQVLDHILVTRAVTDLDYHVVHLNAEFSDQASDHDPQVVRIRPTVRQGTLALEPSSITAGGATTVRLAGWYPNRTFTVSLDDRAAGAVTTDATGAGSVDLTVPLATASGAHTVSVTSPASGSASVPLTVRPPPAAGSVTVLPPVVAGGWYVFVYLDRWPPGTEVTLTLDGMFRLGTVRSDAGGRAVTLVRTPRTTPPGPHTLVATGPDGGRAGAPVRVR